MDIKKIICELESGTRRIDDYYDSACEETIFPATRHIIYRYTLVAYRMGDNIRIDLKRK